MICTMPLLKTNTAAWSGAGLDRGIRGQGVDACMYGRILCAGGRKTGYAQSMAMSKLQEIEKAIELLPLADQLRLYRDIPHLIGRDREDLEWKRLAIEEFFKDDSPDDAVYDDI